MIYRTIYFEITVAEIPPADNAFHREQQLQESSPKLPKKKKSLEESSPIAKKNEDENLNELQDNAPLEQFPKKKKMKIVETVEEKRFESIVSLPLPYVFSRNFVILKNVLISERRTLRFKFFFQF